MPYSTPGEEEVVLEVGERRIDHWEEYSFNQHFLIPTDGFSFSMGGDSITPDLIKLLKPGVPVRLTINGLVQCAGYIDVVDPKTSRTGGARITVEGRDKFGPVVDAQIDPRKKWKDSTLDKFIADTLEPFGFTTFFVDNERNVNVQAGKAVKRRRVAKKLKEFRTSYGKPQNNEAVFSFVSRITQRFGLWIWPTVEGSGVVVGSPDFDQDPRYTIVNRVGGGEDNNVLEGGVRRDMTGQPSYIEGRGRIPGKTFQRTKTSVVIGNPIPELVGNQETPGVQGTGEGLGEAGFSYWDTGRRVIVEKETITLASAPVDARNEFASTVARPIFLTDDHSRTIEELQKFVQREMSLRIRHAIVGRYIVQGHAQNGVPWTVDSVASVNDELSDWDRPMWVLSRTFRKSRSSGTTTELELIPLKSLVF
jgi:prophage tail gpP-like protein